MFLETRGAGFSYEKGKPVFGGVNLSLEEGDVLCLLGPNGAGKSTFLQCLDRILSLDKGEVLLDGRSIASMTRRQISREISFLPQFHRASFPFRVIEIVLMGRTPHMDFLAIPGKKEIRLAREMLDSLGVLHLEEKPYTQISGGERQLVLLASALVQEPRLLLLDEPTSHLDFGNQARFLEVVNRLAQQGISIVMTTHFPDHALLTASKVAILKEGKVLGFGSPHEILTEGMIRETYGIDVRLLDVGATGIRTCVPILAGKKCHRNGISTGPGSAQAGVADRNGG